MSVNQVIVTRTTKIIDENIDAFGELITRRESLGDFVSRVTKVMQDLDTIFVSYPNESTAIIQYHDK